MRFTRKATAALVAIGVVLGASAAQAQSFTYQTYFSNDGTNFFASVMQTFGSGANTSTLTFTGQALTTDEAPTGVNFGTITASATGSGSTVDDTRNIYLQLVQYDPAASPNNSTTTGSYTYAGAITTSSSGLTRVTFDPAKIFLGSMTYAIDNPTTIHSPQTEPVRITAVVTTPEPASMTLLATGLVGIFGAARRRRAKNS